VRWIWNEGERAVIDADDTDALAASLALDPPVDNLRMVWAIGLNYRDHAAETGAPLPPEPVVFVKSTGSVVGHGADILIPPHVTQPDYEGELAVVIGQRARDVPEDEALDVVEGVTCAHDVSSRDHQFTTGQWSWSKSFDTFCPLGPVLVSPDELDLGNLAIETRVNGEVLQCSNTDQLVFGAPQLIAHLSRGLTLEPGDVILTGTPGGVGMARNPQRWLEDGDVVEITIAGIGTLRNRVVRR
jgi:2-keto-4-pentenoate hydratase/2-oxohepta-3-ene-1,7-dioic acid hydratase in catechol pathway